MAPYPHMPAGAQPIASTFSSRPVTYTATGAEGVDFNVPIGYTMADTTYAVVWASGGGTSGAGANQSSGVPIVDMPIASRTTTTFRVVLGQALAAGDKLQFVVTGSFL